MIKYKFGGQSGKTMSLKVSEDLLAIRGKRDHPITEARLSDASRSLLSEMVLVASFPEANVSIYRCVGRGSRTARKVRNDARDRLSAEQEVRFAGRTLVDQQGVLHLYTENAFVKFEDALKVAECKAIIKNSGFKVKRKGKFAKNAFLLEAAEGTGLAVFEMVDQLLQRSDVEFCHPEIIKQRKVKKIGPQQWHLKKTKISGREIDAHVHVKEAWQSSKGEGVVIAVIDEGIDVDHPEFSGSAKIVSPRDFLKDSDDPRPQFDFEKHGTACAGVALANGKGSASGVAPEASLMPLRLIANLGSLLEAEAITWAADKGADIISCSWGPPDGAWWDASDPAHIHDQPIPDSTRLAIEYAAREGRNGKGCLIVWAAGNGRENVLFDGYASHPDVIAVSASNDRNKRCVYSDFGEQIFCCFPSGDMEHRPFNHDRPLSPGIWTTDNMGAKGYNPGSNFAQVNIGDQAGSYTASFSGTSSSTPGVAGVIALMLSLNPELKAGEVKEILKQSCDKIDPSFGNYDSNGHSLYYGYGKLNALKAVQNTGTANDPMPSIRVSGYLGFRKKGATILQEGQRISSDRWLDKLIGISLQLKPFHPELGIQYQLIYNNIGVGSIGNDGQYISHGDKRRKAIGLSIQLTGALSDEYSVRYQIKRRRSDDWIAAKDGQVCGAAAGRGEAIVGCMVEIVRL